jgi:hypothetical protein
MTRVERTRVNTQRVGSQRIATHLRLQRHALCLWATREERAGGEEEEATSGQARVGAAEVLESRCQGMRLGFLTGLITLVTQLAR